MKKPLRNALAAFLASATAALVGFVAQKIFISTLGIELLGLNSLFSNIITMLSVTELGIGSAIIYNLYAPIKRGDKQLTASLMEFYKRAYRVIALVVGTLGVLLLPFLPMFISGPTPDANIYVSFLLILLDMVSSYVLVYRRSILYATQENYITSIVHIGYLLVLNTAQILALLLTKNYYLYLAIKIVIHILENLIVHLITRKKYPYLSNKEARQLPVSTKKDISIKTKALLSHKFAGFVISGTDNIVISTFLGLTTVGLYSNYYAIFLAAETILSQAITALTPTVGHILVDKDPHYNFFIFKRVRRFTFLIAGVTSLALLVLVTPFIKLWLGSQYLLATSTLFIFVLHYFQKLMRASFMTFKEAAGIYHEDRFVPIVESVINIIASVVLVQFIGLPGVIIGTILSSLVLWCFSYPKFVYKPLFGRSYRQYALETVAYFVIFAIVIVPVFLLLTK